MFTQSFFLPLQVKRELQIEAYEVNKFLRIDTNVIANFEIAGQDAAYTTRHIDSRMQIYSLIFRVGQNIAQYRL